LRRLAGRELPAYRVATEELKRHRDDTADSKTFR
jgi:hypothetical protein